MFPPKCSTHHTEGEWIMALFVGMDVTEVRTLATQLNQKDDEIEQIANALSNQLGSTQWVGNDATRFRGDWDGQHRKALSLVANALKDAASNANRNAQQQEDDSMG